MKIVHVSVANIYKESNYHSETTTQALLGEKVEILGKERYFLKVKQNDGYTGWMSSYQLSEPIEGSFPEKTIRSHQCKIYLQPDKNARVIRDAVCGAKVSVVDKLHEWVKIILPDGMSGFIHNENFGEFPQLTRENIGQFAHEFLGIPYFWGGRSTKGLDCSGFVQTAFNLGGAKLPRDSWMQQRDTQLKSLNYADGEKGDLIFFGSDKKKVDHVGICLGNQIVIHSRGLVRINSLNSEEYDFNQDLVNTFISIHSIF